MFTMGIHQSAALFSSFSFPQGWGWGMGGGGGGMHSMVVFGSSVGDLRTWCVPVVNWKDTGQGHRLTVQPQYFLVSECFVCTADCFARIWDERFVAVSCLPLSSNMFLPTSTGQLYSLFDDLYSSICQFRSLSRYFLTSFFQLCSY